MKIKNEQPSRRKTLWNVSAGTVFEHDKRHYIMTKELVGMGKSSALYVATGYCLHFSNDTEVEVFPNATLDLNP